MSAGSVEIIQQQQGIRVPYFLVFQTELCFLQEVEGKVQEIRKKVYVGLTDALQHSWKSFTPKTHKLMPVLLCESLDCSHC